MNPDQTARWRDNCRDALAYVAALHRGDDEAAELLLDHGDARDMCEALAFIYLGTMATGLDAEKISVSLAGMLSAVAPQAVD